MTLARYYGYSDPDGLPAGFVVPVFTHGEKKLVQEIGPDDRVLRFTELPTDAAVHPGDPGTSVEEVSEGAPAVYAFRFADGTVIAAVREALEEVLAARRTELEAHPFTLMDVLDFIHDYEGASRLAASLVDLFRVEGNRPMQRWAERSLRRFTNAQRGSTRRPTESWRVTSRFGKTRVRAQVQPGSGGYQVNGAPLEHYLRRSFLQRTARRPLESAEGGDLLDVQVDVQGGGLEKQADAIQRTVADALAGFVTGSGGDTHREPGPRRSTEPGRGLRDASLRQSA
jgi:ribosomal protein S9